MSDVNRVLDAIERGQTRAADELLPLVYDELRRLAAWKMAHESEGQTLQPTALVHEAWLRLAGANAERPFQGRTHFMAAAAEAMRLILIDRARRRKAQKRGCGAKKLDLDQVNAAAQADSETLLMMEDALVKLAREDPRAAELIKLRFFAGLTNEEAAQALGISERSAKRYWTYARAWLYREISKAAVG
jgi:RNA polymerase sigma factor (TIGR02999 family)